MSFIVEGMGFRVWALGLGCRVYIRRTPHPVI